MKSVRISRLNGWLGLRNALMLGLAVALALALSTPGWAQTVITVTDLGDPSSSSSGGCTLRDAINLAQGNAIASGDNCGSSNGAPYTIKFGLTGTIALSGHRPKITGNLTINGAGGITIDGGGTVQMMGVALGATVNLNGLIIETD